METSSSSMAYSDLPTRSFEGDVDELFAMSICHTKSKMKWKRRNVELLSSYFHFTVLQAKEEDASCLNLLCALPSESETSVSELALFQQG